MAKEKRTISLLEQALSLGQNGGIYYVKCYNKVVTEVANKI